MCSEDSIKRNDDLEQEIIRRYNLNEVEVFYAFSSTKGTIRERVNKIFEIRGEPWFIPKDSQDEE